MHQFYTSMKKIIASLAGTRKTKKRWHWFYLAQVCRWRMDWWRITCWWKSLETRSGKEYPWSAACSIVLWPSGGRRGEKSQDPRAGGSWLADDKRELEGEHGRRGGEWGRASRRGREEEERGARRSSYAPAPAPLRWCIGEEDQQWRRAEDAPHDQIRSSLV